MLKQEPGLVEPIIRREIGNAQALKLEQSLISGTGTDKEPRGIVNYSNVQTESVGTNGGRFKFEHADNMVGSIEDADHNLADGSYGFLFYPKTRRLLRNEQVSMYSGDTDGEYRLGVPIITDALLREVLGYDFYTTTLVPHTLTKGSGTALSNVVFGDWSQIMLAMWGGMEIRTSTEAGDAFTKNQIYIAAYLACDIQVRDETKFCVVSDAATSA
jgi:HK97 family phage major capsid protein